MKKLTTILFFIFPLLASATTYYVKPSGNDGATGTSTTSAWKTVAKVNATLLQPGDIVLFARGGTWNETLIPRTSGTSDLDIVFAAYGEGEDPIFTSMTTLTNWTNVGGGLFSTQISTQSMPAILTLNGENTPMGRTPNAGSYLWGDDFSGTTSVTDAALPSSPNLTGGRIVVRTARWRLDRATITGHSGTTLTFSSLGNWLPPDGTGYFVMNLPALCDQFGEWAYVSANSTLFMYFAETTPSQHTITIPTRNNLLYINGKEYLDFQNLQFIGGNQSTVYINGAANISLSNCNINLSGERGIYGVFSDYVTIGGCTINNSNSDGIEFTNSTSHITITSSRIFNSGTLEGMSIGGDEAYTGIINRGHYGTITYNTIYNSGYDGVRFNGNQSVVSYNFIDTYCFLKDDGAGIYMFSDENATKTIEYNTIINGIGAPESWNHGSWYENNLTHSIYMDGSDNTEIAHNNCGHNVGAGIFNNVAINNYIHHNTMFDNGQASLFLTDYVDYQTHATENDIEYNIYCAVDYATTAPYWQHTFYLATSGGTSTIDDFGTSNYNYFLRPASNDNYIDVWINTWGWQPGDQSYYNLAEWQALSGFDANSHSTPATVSSTADIHWIYNETGLNKTFELSAAMVDHAGTTRSGEVTLQPYTSLVLIGAGTITDGTPGSQTIPEVYTSAVTAITQTSASTGGLVIDDGGASITNKGICWSQTANPTIANQHTSQGIGMGEFTTTLTGLTPGTTYHVRAYAVNDIGYGYGEDRSFTTGTDQVILYEHEGILIIHDGYFLRND